MIIKQASDLHFTYVENTPELREAFIAKCNEFGILVWVDDDKIGSYLEVFACPFDCDDKFEIVFTDNLEFQSKELFIGDLIDIPTETPEEKEVLDGIESVGEVDWNGNGLPPVGVECEWIGGGLNHGDWGLVVVHAYHNGFAWIEKLRDNSMHTVGNPAHFRKPETPQQREDRERLEAAYELCCIYGRNDFESASDFKEYHPSLCDKWLAIVDKTNYRKEKSHGTN